jgi:hypothetical protein
MIRPAHSPHNHRRSGDHSRQRRYFCRQNWRSSPTAATTSATSMTVQTQAER